MNIGVLALDRSYDGIVECIKPWWTPWDARAALERLAELERGAA